MSIDNDWEFKASHWEKEAKRLIVENNDLKNEILLGEGKATAREFADRMFNLAGFMLSEEYRGKPAVTITFPDNAERNQFYSAIVDLSTHKTPSIGQGEAS